MTATLLHQTTRRARKAHRCGACNLPIEPGELYLDQRVAGDGTAWTWREHPLCHSVYWRIHREAGLDNDDSVDPDEVRAEVAAIRRGDAP